MKNPEPPVPLALLRESFNWLAGLCRARHAFSVMLIIGLWLALAAFVTWDARVELRRARTQTDTLADAIAAHTSRVLREADEMAAVVEWEVRKLGLGLPLSDYTPPGLLKLYPLEQISVVDSQGAVRSSTAPRFDGVNIADREHFAIHVDNPGIGLFIGNTVVGRVSGKPSVQLSRRIDDSSGRFLGVVVVSIAPSYLTEFYEALRVGNRGMISVIGTGDYVVRARRSGPSNASDLQLLEDDPLRKALTATKSGHLSGASPVDGVYRTMSYRRLADYPVAVVVGFSVTDFLRAFRGRALALLLAGIVLTVLILAAEKYRAILLAKMKVADAREREADSNRVLKAQRIESLFMAVPDATVGFSPEGEIDGYNPNLLTLLGWSADDLPHATAAVLAAAFFREDESAVRDEKASRMASMLCDVSADGATSAVFQLESSTPAVYELRVERRCGSSTGTVALFRDITAQSRIADSERDLESTLQAIGDAVVSVDERGRVKRMNLVAEIFSGWKSADAVGRHHTDVFSLTSATTGACAAAPIDEVLMAQQVVRLADRHSLLSLNGGRRNVTLSASPIRGHGDLVNGVVLVLRDVSREYASEQALMESEARYRQLIALSPYAVFLGQNRIIKFANPKALEMLRAHTPQQVVGRSLLDFLHPDSIPAVEKRMARLHDERAAVPPMEEKWLRVDGTTFIGEAMAVPYEIDGAPAVLAMLHDISGRKEAEAERDRLFSLSRDLTCVVEPTGYFKRVNPAFSRVLGWSADELLARPFIEFVHPEDRERTTSRVCELCFGPPMDHFENRYLCKDGSSRWLSWSAAELDGVVYATARDVTEIYEATRQLEQATANAEAASRAKSAFLAMMSHEIRTPMNGVIGMTEVLARTQLACDQHDMVSTIRNSGHSLLAIIDDILDFSKIEAGKLDVEHAPVPIVELAENVCASLLPVAQRAGVSLSITVEPEVPDVVLCDDTRLRQVLYNLVGNAVKFSGRRSGRVGNVSVRLDVDSNTPGEVRIHVADDGIGMSEHTIAGLFTPFSQAEVSTTRKFGGTGLGLAICHRLVSLMGGKITVSSNPGVGSTFVVTLPCHAPVSGQIDRQPDLDGITCLVLRSIQYDAEAIRAWLTRARAEVFVVDSLNGSQQAFELSCDSILIVRDDGPALQPFQLLDLGEDAPSAVAEVRIARAAHPAMLREGRGIVVIGAEGLRRQPFRRAAMVAVGRAMLETAVPTANAALLVKDESHPVTVAGAREQGRLILVAEDDEINQKVILRQLALLGHVAEVASDGAEALDLWRRSTYALLLTDLHMPDLDGYELAEAIRREESRRGARIPIIALTANAIQGEAARAVACGMDGYLTKPLQLARLQAVLERHFPDVKHAPEQEIQPPQPGDAQSLSVDTNVLKGIVGDDPEVMRELLGDYLKSVQHLAVELRTHCLQGRGREAGSVAHKLKSSSRSIGATSLADLCAELENAGKTGDLATLVRWVEHFDVALAVVEREIASMLQ